MFSPRIADALPVGLACDADLLGGRMTAYVIDCQTRSSLGEAPTAEWLRAEVVKWLQRQGVEGRWRLQSLLDRFHADSVVKVTPVDRSEFLESLTGGTAASQRGGADE
ncbi:MAG: hypothetical protein KGN16_20075 [Burkholderiales bacterium]|nr:hypothetical protein [Burkholderiales bacterium]